MVHRAITPFHRPDRVTRNAVRPLARSASINESVELDWHQAKLPEAGASQNSSRAVAAIRNTENPMTLRLSWLVMIGMTACSPYAFQQEVTSFSTSVDQLSDAVTSGYTNLASDRAAKNEFELTSTRAKVFVAASCGVPITKDNQPCELFRSGLPEPTAMRAQELAGRALEVVSVLKNYARALAAVTNSADRTAFDAAVMQLSGSVANLAQTANAAAPGAGAIAPAAVKLAGWVVGTALDQARFDSLKRGVNFAAEPVRTIAGTLRKGLEDISSARQTVLVAEADLMAKRLGPSLDDSSYQQQLTQAEATVSVLDALRYSDPAGTADSLKTAHDALVAAVNDPNRSYASLLKAVSDFSEKAAALKAAFSASSPASAGL